MARARNLKPSFFKNEDLAELQYEGRLLFAGLWCLADREGRLEDRPKKIKMEIFPADSVDVDKLLQKLHDSKFILRYEVAGKRYILVVEFKKHQNPHHREHPSTIPPPRSLGLATASIEDESEALAASQACRTPGQTGASPGTAVLIPDSLNLIPDSPFPIKPFAPSASTLDAGAAPVNGHDLSVVERIPIIGGQEWPVLKPFVEELDRLYPAVEPVQTLREIRGWCLGNPTKRKTKRGVRAFIVSWFAREQDKQSRRVA